MIRNHALRDQYLRAANVTLMCAAHLDWGFFDERSLVTLHGHFVSFPDNDLGWPVCVGRGRHSNPCLVFRDLQ